MKGTERFSYCKNCNKYIKKGGRRTLYCSQNCKLDYYRKIKIPKINLVSPEEFIHEELNKVPITASINNNNIESIRFSKVIESETRLEQNKDLSSLNVKRLDIVSINIKVIQRINSEKPNSLNEVSYPAVVMTNGVLLSSKHQILKLLKFETNDVIEITVKVLMRYQE